MQDSQLRETPVFKEYVERLFTPLRPGLAYVSTDEYIRDDFEEDMLEIGDRDEAHFQEGPLLDRARADCKQWIGTLELLFLEHIHADALNFMRNPEMYKDEQFSWGATNPNDLTTNLAGFADQLIGKWQEEHLPSYRATLYADPTLTEPQRDALAHYMLEYISSAAAAVPYHNQDWGQELYYDSATTEEGDDDAD